MAVRVRFAPSPTGHLHIGSARTALINYLFAKQHGGQYILRIEDTDQTRHVQDATERFMAGFKWLGLLWDEGPDIGGAYGPYTCMQRLDLYAPYIEQLIAGGQAYPCFCSRAHLEAERERASGEGRVYRYDGRCRTLSAREREERVKDGQAYTIRLKLGEQQEIKFHDLVRGEMMFDTKDMDDFIIVKSDGVPMYNFAVTIDDALMKITHVIRGEEHLSNTPNQILLYQALGWSVPIFAHLPLILNPDGRKLSKRDQSLLQFIDQYQELGYLPAALNNFLVLLGWSPEGEEEIFSMAELIKLFSFDRVGRAGAIFDPGKLLWMNEQYIKRLPVSDLSKLAAPHLTAAYGEVDEGLAEELTRLLQTALKKISDIVPQSSIFFSPLQMDEDARRELATVDPSLLQAMVDELSHLDPYADAEIKAALRRVQERTGQKGRALFMPLRAATTGQLHGLDLTATLRLLGREKVLARLLDAIEVGERN